MRTRVLPLAAALAALSAIYLAPASHAADDASVYVLHGVPGATVDVYVNGDAALTNFAPGTLTDALSLPAGEYDLKVTAPGAGADGAAIIEANDVAVPAGANVTVVAHLDASGSPTLTPFVNDTSKTAAGQGRLTVRHTAAAPAVDVRANGAVAFSNVTNPDEAKADLTAGTISADVVLAGTDTVAIGPADVPVTEGANTIVYAWGSAADDNLAFAVQALDGLHSAPSGVPTGTAPVSDATMRLLAASSLAVAAAGVVLLGMRRAESVEL